MRPIHFNRKAFVLAFIVTLSCWAVAWAITTDQIWQKIYDSANSSLRITQVSP